MFQSGTWHMVKAKHLNSNQDRAVRCVRKSSRSQEDLDKEVEILNKLDHGNIANLYDVFYGDTLCYDLVTEFCNRGRLVDEILKKGSLAEPEAASITDQILRTIAYMHGQRVCHRDIRPEVIMLVDTADSQLQNCHIRLVDLSSACDFKPGKVMKGQVGTVQYACPQMIIGAYTESCDVCLSGQH